VAAVKGRGRGKVKDAKVSQNGHVNEKSSSTEQQPSVGVESVTTLVSGSETGNKKQSKRKQEPESIQATTKIADAAIVEQEESQSKVKAKRVTRRT
jgi:hypothetical protein